MPIAKSVVMIRAYYADGSVTSCRTLRELKAASRTNVYGVMIYENNNDGTGYCTRVWINTYAAIYWGASAEDVLYSNIKADAVGDYVFYTADLSGRTDEQHTTFERQCFTEHMEPYTAV